MARTPGRLIALVVCASASSAAAHPVRRPVAFAPAAPAQIASGGPRLVIVDAELVPTGTCRDGEPMLEVRARIANQGNVGFPGSSGYGLVGADMTKFGSMIGNGGVVPEIVAGATVVVRFPIYFPIGQPQLLSQATRYELKLDRYGRYPAEEMDPHIQVRTLARPPCGQAHGASLMARS
jgi:hypothetical protein